MIKAVEAMALSDAVVREGNEKRLARYEEAFNSFITDIISGIEKMILARTKSGAYAIYSINILHIYFTIVIFKVIYRKRKHVC